MNEELKKRFEQLKKKNRLYEIQKSWENNVLLQECIEATGGRTLNYDDGNKIMDEIQEKIPFKLGRVDFSKFKFKTNIFSIDDISKIIESSIDIYIMWDIADLPCLKSKIKDVLNNIDDVTAVSFDTWIVSTDYNTVIEFYHEGEITYGIR